MSVAALCLFTLVALLFAAAASLKFAPIPYVFIAVSWSIMLTFVAKRVPCEPARVVIINLIWFLVGVGVIEGGLWIQLLVGDDTELGYPEGYGVVDEQLGIAPTEGSWNVTRRHGDELVYNVTYTIGSNRLRIGSPVDDTAGTLQTCALFFGGSFTFGEGVRDHETIPYLVASRSSGRHRAFNFGFHGYGTHQMLAALESGIVKERVDCRATHVVYQAIPGHVHRANGLASFGRHGPRYLLRTNGKLHRVGHFDDEDVERRANRPKLVNMLIDEVRWQLGKSSIVKFLGRREHGVDAKHIDLFLEIVVASRNLVQEQFPGAEFDVVLWSRDGQYRLSSRLHERGLRVHVVEDILPRYAEEKWRYELSPHDGHPSVAAYRLLADYIRTEILERRDRSGE